jgi:hypothetical protein
MDVWLPAERCAVRRMKTLKAEIGALRKAGNEIESQGDT